MTKSRMKPHAAHAAFAHPVFLFLCRSTLQAVLISQPVAREIISDLRPPGSWTPTSTRCQTSNVRRQAQYMPFEPKLSWTTRNWCREALLTSALKHYKLVLERTNPTSQGVTGHPPLLPGRRLASRLDLGGCYIWPNHEANTMTHKRSTSSSLQHWLIDHEYHQLRARSSINGKSVVSRKAKREADASYSHLGTNLHCPAWFSGVWICFVLALFFLLC
ncbi:hypothetical protein B0H13DRAFT_1905906 [Mycena leptocephala]|nr:hypothetical protein B0H13DRAFT_1905906 [Mycena leptocephala]